MTPIDEALYWAANEADATDPPFGIVEAVDLGLFDLGDWKLTDEGERYVEVMSGSLGWKGYEIDRALLKFTGPAADRLRTKLDHFESLLAKRRDRALRRHFDS
jgi:hypothetical protein